MNANQCILIVDDERLNRNLLAEILKSDYKVIMAKNGEQAIQRVFSDKPPDLILLDIIMPGMDGYEVCRQIKTNEKSKNIPVIFVTTVSEVMDETKGFSVGAVDYVTKPFHPPIVKARVSNHLKNKLQTENLEHLAGIDGLTNIFNRNKFDQMLVSEWKRAHRSQTALSAILIDLDFFKTYNDNYGHAIGDECLRKVALILKNCIMRPGDFLARYDGQVFVAMLPTTDSEGANKIAIKMKDAIESQNIPHKFSPINNHLTISAGISTFYPHKGDHAPIELMETADKMLYKAKESGRNQVQIDQQVH